MNLMATRALLDRMLCRTVWNVSVLAAHKAYFIEIANIGRPNRMADLSQLMATAFTLKRYISHVRFVYRSQNTEHRYVAHSGPIA